MITISKKEAFNLKALFLLFGYGLIVIAPRTPDLKHNLGVNNGTFGTLLSFGAVGALTGLYFMGHLVHRFGPRRVLVVSATVLYISMGSEPHIQSPWLFFIVNIIAASAWAGYHIAVNTHALHRQNVSGVPILPKLHGLWSAGALLTAITGALIASHVTLAWHVDIVVSSIWVMTMVAIYNTRKEFNEEGEETEEEIPSSSFSTLIIFIRQNWKFMSYAAIAILLEASTNDWASLFAKEEIKANSSLSILAYIGFGTGMILGRLNLHRFYVKFSERFLLYWSAVIGGAGFIIFELLAKFLVRYNHGIALASLVVAFFVGGLGSAMMSPGFTTIAVRESKFPAAVVVAQFAIVQTLLIFILKIAISWVAQATSISIAMLIPGIALLVVVQAAQMGSSEIQKS